MKTLIEIELAVCEVFGINTEFIHEKSRENRRPTFRYVIFFVCLEINGNRYTLKEIASYFNVTNSTVLYGLNTISNELETNPKFKAQIIEVFKKLGEKTKLVNEIEEVKELLKNKINNIYNSGSFELIELYQIFDLIEKL